MCVPPQFMSETRSTDLSGTSIDPEVIELVDYIWSEASGQLEDVLAVPVSTIKVEQLDKAEASLLTIKRLLQEETKQGTYPC